MCLAWDPTWTAVARETHVRRDTVLAIFFVVQKSPSTHYPTPETVAISIGARKAHAANRVLAAMRNRRILGENNRPIGEWADDAGVTTKGDVGVTEGDATVTRGDAAVTSALTGAQRQARYKARKRAAIDAAGRGIPAPLPASPSARPQEEEEERNHAFHSSEPGAPEPETVVKRRALYNRIIEAAPRILSERDHRWCIEHFTEERVGRFLERGSGALPPRLKNIVELLIKRTQWHADTGSSQQLPRRQIHLKLPIQGGRRAELSAIAVGGLHDALARMQGVIDERERRMGAGYVRS
jgi:hypothetical protein